jgi:hypothetical protein
MEVFTGIRNGCEATAGLAKGIKGMFNSIPFIPDYAQSGVDRFDRFTRMVSPGRVKSVTPLKG